MKKKKEDTNSNWIYKIKKIVTVIIQTFNTPT